MPRYTEKVELAFTCKHEDVAIIPDSGTSVAVEFWTGTEWIADASSPITTPNTVFVRNCIVRATPDVGGFWFAHGDYQL